MKDTISAGMTQIPQRAMYVKATLEKLEGRRTGKGNDVTDLVLKSEFEINGDAIRYKVCVTNNEDEPVDNVINMIFAATGINEKVAVGGSGIVSKINTLIGNKAQVSALVLPQWSDKYNRNFYQPDMFGFSRDGKNTPCIDLVSKAGELYEYEEPKPKGAPSGSETASSTPAKEERKAQSEEKGDWD